MKASEITDSMRRCQHREPPAKPRNYWCPWRSAKKACVRVATAPAADGLWYCRHHLPVETTARKDGDEPCAQNTTKPSTPSVEESTRGACAKVASASNGASVVRPDAAPKRKKPIVKRRRVMNRTERAFSERLEAQRLAGEIVSWEFEGMGLRWGNEETFKYSPDFVVLESVEHVAPVTVNSFPHVRLIFIEIKGSFVWKDDSTRFRHARDNFPLYEFQMFQKTKMGWEQIR